MTTEQIAYFALLSSIVSLVVSFLNLYRDRHVVRVRAVAVMDLNGVPELNVSVSNCGKRAISINHVLLRPPGHPGLYLNFSPNGQNRVDVGESRSCQIHPAGLPVKWATLQELHSINVYVEDAVGKQHKATFQGRKGPLSWLKRLAGRR
ncbi:hypothetical protein [Desulfonatronum thiosulfatophilum]|uniref:hypothetical protein n=1 Tax=Desulfonatronum thiosulfatophilum TaxID=617002 RepID=UPI001113C65D|nr:hypothetical protein [Desulfonatronum thiosulfatophilum]